MTLYLWKEPLNKLFSPLSKGSEKAFKENSACWNLIAWLSLYINVKEEFSKSISSHLSTIELHFTML